MLKMQDPVSKTTLSGLRVIVQLQPTICLYLSQSSVFTFYIKAEQVNGRISDGKENGIEWKTPDQSFQIRILAIGSTQFLSLLVFWNAGNATKVFLNNVFIKY